MSTVKFKDQDYHSLHRRLARRKQKFEDPEFSTEGCSDWRRPSDFDLRPRLITDGVSGSDVTAGDSGCDWFVTACSVLTIRPGLIALVLPGYHGQDYGGNFHPGIFRFAFGRRDRVYEVVVDDRLPASGDRPRRCRSADGAEFWGALLEKAYAKLHGGYHTLQYGRVADAIASFARGIPDHWDLRQLCAQVDLASAPVQERLARLLQCHVNRDGLLLFSLKADGKSSRSGEITPENLVYGRGYLLTDVQPVRLQDGTNVWLLKLRTALYSDTREFVGPWRDGANEWNQLDAESASRVHHWFKDDCIFWMSLQDALTRFTDLDMCVAGEAGRFNNSMRWITTAVEGQWSDADCASPDPLAGPQFLLRVRGDGFQTVSFCLEYGGPETPCRPDQQANVGLDLIRAEENRLCRLRRPGPPSCLVARLPPQRRPALTLGATFAPGTYILLPHTLGPPDGFTLRAFSRLGFELRALTKQTPGALSCTQRKRQSVSRLVVEWVTGLATWLEKDAGEVKMKLCVSCDYSNVESWYSRYYAADQSQPDTFPTDLRLLIHRYRAGESVRIEVFHSTIGSYTKSPVGWASIGESAVPTGHDVALIGWDGQPIGVTLHCSLCTLEDVDDF